MSFGAFLAFYPTLMLEEFDISLRLSGAILALGVIVGGVDLWHRLGLLVEPQPAQEKAVGKSHRHVETRPSHSKTSQFLKWLYEPELLQGILMDRENPHKFGCSDMELSN